MDKGNEETKLQVLISPILVVVVDTYQERREAALALSRGSIVLEGLQVRGHAMFTKGLHEYSWLVEVTVGEVTGQCTSHQLNTLVHCIQSLVFLIKDQENEILPSRDFEYCQHLWPRTECPKWQYKHICPCPNEADVKYKLLRIIFDGLQINFVEDSICLQVSVAGPVHLVNCNLHGPTTTEGISAVLPELTLKQFIKPLEDINDSNKDNWVEAGFLSLGDVVLNAGIALPLLEYRQWQDQFLRFHDKKTKRLWFMWNDLNDKEQDQSLVCGCIGGCSFFGENYLNNKYSRGDQNISESNKKAAKFVSKKILGNTKLLTFGESLFVRGKWIFERHINQKCCEIGSGWILLREKCEREQAMRNYVHSLSVSSESVSSNQKVTIIPIEDEEEPILDRRHNESYSHEKDMQSFQLSDDPVPIKRRYSLKSLMSCETTSTSSEHRSLSMGNTDDEKEFFHKAYNNENDDEESSDEIRAKYVDLRGQLHKTITESNLLYSAYQRHLSTYRCSQWAVPVTVKYFWTKYYASRLPLFHYTQEGFSPKLIVNRIQHKRSQRNQKKSYLDYITGCRSRLADHDSVDSGSKDTTAKTTVSIKFNDAINVLVTPLFVECMTRYVTILTPELTHSFTSTVVNRLHFQSVQLTLDRCKPMKVTSSNPNTMTSGNEVQIKRDTLLNDKNDNDLQNSDALTNSSENVFESASHWVQRKVTSVLAPNLSGLTPLVEENPLNDELPSHTVLNMEEIPMTIIDRKYTETSEQCQETVVLVSQILADQSRVSRTQFSVNIDRVNVCVMQLYAIEDIVNSDTLVSGLHDLTCVSLMSFCLDTALFQILINARSEPVKDGFMKLARPLNESRLPSDTNINMKTKHFKVPTGDRKSMRDFQDNDGFIRTEEMIANIEIKRIHGQLRRLTRDSQFSSEVLLTAIPFNTSKVFFAFESDPGGPLSNIVMLDERSAGWIMFECGLEDLILRGVRRRGFPDSVDDYSKKSPHREVESEEDSQENFASSADNIYEESKKSKNAMLTQLKVRQVWLNFPAPKKLPNKKRINITRDDWNFLSTATPMIKAWMDPCDRLMRACDKLKHLTERRQLAVLACIMTQISHENISHFSNIMFGHKDKAFNFYDKWRTTLARAVRYEPTCQIFTLCRMYMQSDDNVIMNIERSLKDDTLPQIVTLQRGILALTRHWQHLVEVDPRVKSTLFNGFQRNENENNLTNQLPEGSLHRIYNSDGLLHIPTATSQLFRSCPVDEFYVEKSPDFDTNQDQEVSSHQSDNPIMQRFLQDANKACSSEFMKDLNENNQYQCSFNLDSQNENEETYPITAPLIEPNECQNNLYENRNNTAFVTNQFKQANFLRAHYRYMEEAQKIFRPLLEIVGLHVKGVRRTTLMKKFGGYFCANGILETFKIDIIQSESNPLSQYNKQASEIFDANASDQLSSLPRFNNARQKSFKNHVSRSTFLCQSFSTRITMRDVIGFGEKKNEKESTNELDIKPTTTQVYLTIQIQTIQQHINMPLLRLVHQFVTMVYCANDTKEDLDNRRKKDWPIMYSMRHKKQNSKGSSNDTVTTGDTTTSSGARSHEIYYTTMQSTLRSDISKQYRKEGEVGETETEHEDIPLCWRQMYSLLDLYSRVPDMKTVTQPTPNTTAMFNISRRSFSLPNNALNVPIFGGTHMMPTIEEVNENASHSSIKPLSQNSESYYKLRSSDQKITASSSNQNYSRKLSTDKNAASNENTNEKGQMAIQRFTFQWVRGERVPLVIFCSGKVRKVDLSAVLSELNLEGKLINLHCSYTQTSRVKGRGMFTDKSTDQSLSIHCGEHETVLFEEIPTHKLDVVHIKGSPSHFVYSSKKKKKLDKNSCFFGLGKFDLVLPHHPVKLKDMMQRSAKRISTTMTEFFRPYNNTANYYTHTQAWECTSSSAFAATVERSSDQNQAIHESIVTCPNITDQDCVDGIKTGPIINTDKPTITKKQSQITITGMSKGLTISVALHQSLMARYQIDPVYMSGIVSADYGKINVSVKNHYLSFISENPPTGVPKSVTIKLPNIMLLISRKTSSGGKFLLDQDKLTQDLVTEEGSYLDVLASVSTLEHTLTTYLLSYIVVTVQLFMKEINEVIQKMAGDDQTNLVNQIPDDFNKSVISDNKLLNRAARGSTKFSFRVSMDGIRLIATTKSGAVKFETQQIDIELSNRVHSSLGDIKTKSSSLDMKGRRSSNKTKKSSGDAPVTEDYKETIFVFALIENISVELGQLFNDVVYSEKTPDFKTLAFFKTAISLRSLLTEEAAMKSHENNREAYLISLIRPIFWIKPVAFHRGNIMWKLYKEEFIKWKKTMSLNAQVITPSGSFQSHQSRSQTTSHQATTPSSSSTGHGTLLGASSSKHDTIFFQLIIDDLGICIPLCPAGSIDSDPRSSLVVTLRNVRLSSCFRQEFASEGEFIDFCIRFDEDFNDGSDDWKPDSRRVVTANNGKEHLVVMNGCVVPNGTFQVCSKLKGGDVANGMVVEVIWKMCGLDTHLDWNIGKRLKTLSTIMTSVINIKESEVTNYHYSHRPNTDYDIGSDCIVLQGQSSKLFDSPRDHIKLNSLVEMIDDCTDYPTIHNSLPRKSVDLHKSKRSKLSQFFIKPKPTSIKRSGSLITSRTQSTYPSPPIKSSWRTKAYDSVDSHLPSSATNSSTMRRPSARQSISEEELPRRGKELHSPSFRRMDTLIRPSTLNINGRFTSSEINRAESVYFDAAENMSIGSNHQDDSEEFEDAISNSKESCSVEMRNVPQTALVKPVSDSSPISEIGIELKLHIHVDSGRCLLHPKISHLDSLKNMDKFMSPLSHFQYKQNPAMISLNIEEEQLNALLKRYQAYLNFSSISSDISVFYIPAVDLQLYYCSKSGLTTSNIIENNTPNKKNKDKKADLYAYVSLKKLPKDLLVHPSLIDFVEQALEALPVLPEDIEFDKSSIHSNNSDDSSNLLTESLPVDIIVHINVEPSTLRFVCVPTSPVQCLMALPSVDLIFTTKRNQFDVSSIKRVPTEELSHEFIDVGIKMQAQHLSDHPQMFAEGGLSVTGILKEFKISIFHPYGSIPGPIDASHSLTLAVQDVRMNLCRMRQQTMLNELNSATDSLTTNNNIKISAICDIGSAEFKFDIRRSQEIFAIPIAWYRSSLARRLFLGDEPTPIPPESNECDNKVLTDFALDDGDTKSIISIPVHAGTLGGHDLKIPVDKSYHRRLSSGDKNKYNLVFDSAQGRMHPKLMSTSASKDVSGRTTLKAAPSSKISKNVVHSNQATNDTSKSCSMTSTWQSLLLFAFNLNKVNIEMSMGSAMGTTNLNLEKIYSRGHLIMDSNKSRNNQIKIGIGEAKFNSQGGIVGGEMSLSRLDVGLHIKEDFNSEPEHKLTGIVDHFEIRIEYMNTNILLGRISLVEISLHDEWHNSVARQQAKVAQKSTTNVNTIVHPSRDGNPCVVILVAGEIKWDQCQFAIGRTTTPDLVKSSKKLVEYFTEQFKESRKTFLMSENFGLKKTSIKKNTTASSRTEDTYDFIYRVFQRHWQSTFNLAMTSFLRLPCYSEGSPEIYSILPAGCLNLGIVGGSLQLIGRGLGVACFGGNFKSAPDWAVFNIQYPTISFETEAQKINDDSVLIEGSTSVENLENNIGEVINIRQVLSLELGGQTHFRPHMVYIVKVKRGRDNATSSKIHPRIDEWFYFAFKPADNAISNFLKANNPQTEKQNIPMVNFANPNTRKIERQNPLKVSTEADLLFIIPSISSRLTTDHRQSMICPQTADDSIDAEVQLSFHTDFHGVLQLGIIDVPWLPTLINSYIQEKIQDSVDCSDKRASTGSPIVQDMRKYNVIHWNLSPECRWLQANQVSVPAFDQILKMIGFHKARTTIPKWLQRGVLDHLDNLLSMLVARVINLMQEEPQNLKLHNSSTDDNV